jgi:hypothetical protein
MKAAWGEGFLVARKIGVFAWGANERQEGKQFFFAKKNQKTPIYIDLTDPCARRRIKVFASFSKKKCFLDPSWCARLPKVKPYSRIGERQAWEVWQGVA